MSGKGLVAVLDKPEGVFSLKEYSLPEPAPGTVLIKLELSGVCGTDIHIYHDHLPGITYPVCLGHEFVGRLAKVGQGVKADFLGRHVAEGDRVIVAPGISCGKCYWCRVAKTPTTCEAGFAYGIFSDGDRDYHFTGGFADYVYCHDPRTVFFKTDLAPQVAVLLEPLSVAVHAATRSGIRPGDTVVIQGSGGVGLTCQICAKLAGAEKIIHVGGPTPYRVSLAKEFGADIVVDISQVTDPAERVRLVRENTLKRMGADVVFECSGVPQAVREGLDMVRRSGSFIEVGHFTDVGSVALNPFTHMCNKNVNLQGVAGGEIEQFVRGLPILESGCFPFGRLVSHELPLDRLNDIMQVPERGYVLDGTETVKICIAP